MNFPLFSLARDHMHPLFQVVKRHLRQWTKPDNHALVLNAASDLTRSKPELVLENMLLRQQLIVLQHQVKRPAFTGRDRVLLVLLASKLRTRKEALVIVQPDTVLRWHRELFCWAWRRKSRPRRRHGRLPLTDDIVALIKRMARDNRTWGAERIRGELLKPGLWVSKSTIQKYVYGARIPMSPKQNWATFLRNHASQVRACDFLQTYNLLFQPLFVLVIIELGSRRVVHFGVTRNPTDAWLAQQLQEATPFEQAPRFLIRDNDRKYGKLFERVAPGTGIEVVRTPYGAPKANPIYERSLGSVRRECLDHLLVLTERHLHKMMKEYQDYFNHSQSHQGIDQRIPCQSVQGTEISGTEQLISRPVLAGLHHDYRWCAAERPSYPRAA